MTGQPEAIKIEYSAVTTHPKESVNAYLKRRDELRKEARDSNRIVGDTAQLLALANSVDADDASQIDHKFIMGKENRDLMELNEN